MGNNKTGAGKLHEWQWTEAAEDSFQAGLASAGGTPITHPIQELAPYSVPYTLGRYVAELENQAKEARATRDQLQQEANFYRSSSTISFKPGEPMTLIQAGTDWVPKSTLGTASHAQQERADAAYEAGRAARSASPALTGNPYLGRSDEPSLELWWERGYDHESKCQKLTYLSRTCLSDAHDAAWQQGVADFAKGVPMTSAHYGDSDANAVRNYAWKFGWIHAHLQQAAGAEDRAVEAARKAGVLSGQHEISDAWREGGAAFNNGVPKSDVPYNDCDEFANKHFAWRFGWNYAQMEHVATPVREQGYLDAVSDFATAWQEGTMAHGRPDGVAILNPYSDGTNEYFKQVAWRRGWEHAGLLTELERSNTKAIMHDPGPPEAELRNDAPRRRKRNLCRYYITHHGPTPWNDFNSGTMVRDGAKDGDPVIGFKGQDETAQRKAEEYLEENYPDWHNPYAYWPEDETAPAANSTEAQKTCS